MPFVFTEADLSQISVASNTIQFTDNNRVYGSVRLFTSQKKKHGIIDVCVAVALIYSVFIGLESTRLKSGPMT